MNDGANTNETVTDQKQIDFKLYKSRWFILFLFCFYACINFAQYLQYSIITNIIAKYYDVSTFAISWTTLVFMICYIVFFLPASYLMEKFDLRQIGILASTLTACGLIIRLFSVSPDRYYVVLIGQTLCAIAQVFILSLPSKVAAVWFGSHEISTACAIAVFGSQLGVAIGCLISPTVVKNHDDVHLIGEELFGMIMYNAIIGCAACFLVILFFKAKPPTPPNYSQLLIEDKTDTEYFKSLKNLMKNRDYLLLLISIGASTGTWNAFGVSANTIYLNYFPGREEDLGWLGLIALFSGGCIGSVIFGYILDKTHRFKLTTFSLLFLSSTMFFISSVLLEKELRIAAYVSLSLFGFFISCLLVVGFEYSAEVTYPEPEATALASLNGIIAVFGIIFSVMFDSFFVALGYFWTNIVIGSILAICSFVIPLLSGDLRRLRMNQKGAHENIGDMVL